MNTIEYCKVIEDWATYHEEDLGCDCDMFEARKCQETGNEICNCQCHLMHDAKKIIIDPKCNNCNFALNQANMEIKKNE